MANTYKNIVITPNIGNTSDPRIQFSGGNTTANTDINLYVYPTSNGTLSFEGSAGQLFSVTNDLSNLIFSVADVSGIPSLEVYANSLISVAPFGGNVVFGNTAELILSPGAGIYANGGLGSAGQVLTSNGTSVYWSAAAAGGVTQVNTGNGMTGGPITTTGTVSVVAGNSQLVSNTTGIWLDQTQVNHNSLTNYVADQHVAHSTITLTAGAGLTGGGTIAANRTFDVGAGNGMAVDADSIRVVAGTGGGLVSNTTGVFALQGTGTVVNATGIHLPATGPGAGSYTSGISALTLDAQGRVTAITGSAGYVTSSGVTSVATGNGIVGGTITGTGTLYADGANGISVDASGINVLANTGIVSNTTGVHVNSAYIATIAPTLTGGGASGTWGINISGTAAAATTASAYLPLAGGTMSGTITNPTASLVIGTNGGSTRGYLYNDTSGFGLLTSGGGWAVRVNFGTTTIYMPGSLNADGNITAYAASDKKLKENIKNIENPLEKISKINGVTFDWKDDEIERRGGEDGHFVRKHEVGVIAQEIEKVLPEIVSTKPDGFKGVRYELLAPLLIESIKELRSKVIDLQKEVEELKRK